MFSFKAKADGIRLLEDNKKIFTIFKYVGMYLVMHDGQAFRISFGYLLLSKLLWMFWHLIGTALAMYVWISSGDADDDLKSPSNMAVIICIVLIGYLFIGPIQSNILKYTMEAFPTILKLVKEIEDVDLESHVKSRYKRIHGSKIILRKRDQIEAEQQRDQLGEKEELPISTSMQRISDVSDIYQTYGDTENNFSANPVVNNCAKKMYKILSKVGFALIIILVLITFGIVIYIGTFDTPYKHLENGEFEQKLSNSAFVGEVKLVAMLFYLVFPVISTWFCLVLIEHHRNMYKVLTRLKDETFLSTDKETNRLKDIATYINKLQKLFQKLSENIFEFTLGMNFLIFTIISTASTYEILQKKEGKSQFADIIYVIPLAICILHIYIVCKRTHDLKNRAYDHLRIRLKEMLPALIMEDDKDKEKIFKRVETLYKNLKDWPPQVSIYGGFIINYRILTGIIIFSLAYARTFIVINKSPGTEEPKMNDIKQIVNQIMMPLVARLNNTLELPLTPPS